MSTHPPPYPHTHTDSSPRWSDAERRAAVRQGRQAGHRAREAAHAAGMSEGEALQAFCGSHDDPLQATPLQPQWLDILKALGDCGPVMALTRNDTAVHEKLGVYERLSGQGATGLAVGEDIDLRLFFKHWQAGFAVSEGARLAESPPALSLQFFDADGRAVHKVFVKPSTDRAAFQTLVQTFADPERRVNFNGLAPTAPANLATPKKSSHAPDPADHAIDLPALQAGWAAMRDTHEFFGLLQRSGAGRAQAFRLLQGRYTEALSVAALQRLLDEAAMDGLPIMVFVSSPGCIQIHSGPVHRVERMDSPAARWLNVLDPGFNLHLREDRIEQVWRVTKPTDDGDVTSIEAFDPDGSLAVMFFGARKPGQPELPAWRELAHRLPALERTAPEVVA
jgi:putative hemin transport protein